MSDDRSKLSASRDAASAWLSAELGDDVPPASAAFARADPELLRQYGEYRGFGLADGALSHKCKLLMGLAVVTSQRAVEPMRLYCQMALAAGATPPELREAVRVGVIFGGSASMNSATQISEFLTDGE
jgi:alkylhydroperoxidase/carboxymuconolactone decarboxylase family protein YurZ